MYNRTVIGIPSSFDKNENLECKSTEKYIKYLESKKAGCVMTTAGTSNFNLLSSDEIHYLNEAVISFDGQKIIGIPPVSTRECISFIKKATKYADEKTFFMALYPERFYNKQTIKDFMCSLRENTKNPLYIHAKPIQNATGGVWDYTSDVINDLFTNNIVQGIKEEHSAFSKSYDFVSELDKSVDVIVAGGSMRRHQFLKSAGANTFLAGVGNLFPEVEQQYLDGDIEIPLQKEIKMFRVFMKYGWHKSLRIALKLLDLTCYCDREPWPFPQKEEIEQIQKIIESLRNEK